MGGKKRIDMTMDVTFLTKDQIWGDNALQVMKDYGTKTGMSDLAIVQGGVMGIGAKTSDDQLAGYVWSASSNDFAHVRTVISTGDRHNREPSRRDGGARPALPSSVTSSIKPSEARLTREISGVQVVEYGEYPQTIAPENVGRELEQSMKRGQLQTTGKKYTFDGEANNAFEKPFKPEEHAEYQHNGKRYIRVEATPLDNYSKLSNGHVPRKPDPEQNIEPEICWIEVKPIEWMVEPKKLPDGQDNPNADIWVARQALFSGVHFDRNNNYDGNFANTDMKQYLQNHFAKEMAAVRNVDAPEVLGASTAAILERREIQRQRALEDPTQGL